jgi:hypothetical protein
MSNLSIKYLGKIYVGKTMKELQNKSGLSAVNVRSLINNKAVLYVTNTKTKSINKLDLSKPILPLLQREFGISSTQAKSRLSKFQSGKISKDWKLTKKLPQLSTVDIVLDIKFDYSISSTVGSKQFSRNYSGFNDQDRIDSFVDVQIHNYLMSISVGAKLVGTPTIEYVGRRFGQSLNFKDMKLREVEALTIFNEDLKNVAVNPDYNCVVSYLLDIYGKRISNNVIKALGDDTGVTPDELTEFCKLYKIKYRCYDINGELKASHTPPGVTKSKRTNLIIVAYNNHVYPITNKFMHKNDVNYDKDVVIFKDLKSKLVKLLKCGLLPVNVKLKGDNTEILYIETEDKVYLDNLEYKKCAEICKKLGIADKLNYSTNFTNVGKTIMKLYVKSDIKSIWPNSGEFVKSAPMYGDGVNHDDDDITTIDKNKAYLNAIMKLPFLTKIDITKHNITGCDDLDEIIEHYWYIAKPAKFTHLMPESSMYTGYHINYCRKNGIDFEITEKIEADKTDNYFKQMIIDLLKVTDQKTCKTIVNRMVGMFQKGIDEAIRSNSFKFVKIANKDETATSNNFVKEITKNYNLIYDTSVMDVDIYTMKPIAYQVLDYNRVLIYEKMQILGLTDGDIVKIKTDSISFKSNAIKDDIDLNIDCDDVGKWKFENYQFMNWETPIDCKLPTFKGTLFKNDQITRSVLGNAGNGKTYDIINNLTKGMTDYKILSPSHASIKYYKKIGMTSGVIQEYTFNNKIPDEHTVIVDEIGMCDRKAILMLIKCIVNGKNVYTYGDYTQLLPVGNNSPMNSHTLIDSMYKEQITLKGNHRNTFTEEYYDKLRKVNFTEEVSSYYEKYYTPDYKYQIDEVKRHNTDWKEAEYIIAYKRSTRNIYNQLKMEHLEIEFGDVGCKLICKTNDLREKGIYNNFIFNVISNDGVNVALDDGNGNITDITVKELNKGGIGSEWFLPAYALTLYCIQGDSLSSYHYPDDDDEFINERSAYTLISRLKN